MTDGWTDYAPQYCTGLTSLMVQRSRRDLVQNVLIFHVRGLGHRRVIKGTSSSFIVFPSKNRIKILHPDATDRRALRVDRINATSRRFHKIGYLLIYSPHLTFLTTCLTMAAVVPVAAPTRPAILPARGTARVKNVLSGDSVILLGKAPSPNARAPEVVFTLESVSAPRYVNFGIRR
jgi:hypothetical protein